MENLTSTTTTTSSTSTTSNQQSKDEVDFIVVPNNNNNNNNINFDLKKKNTNNSISSNNNINSNNNNNNNNNSKTNSTSNTKRNSNSSGNVPNSSVNKQKPTQTQTQVPNKEAVSINNNNTNNTNNNNNNNNNTTVAKSKKLNNAETQLAKKSVTTKERLSLFSFSKKNSQKAAATTPTTPPTPPTHAIYNTTTTKATNGLITQSSSSSDEQQEKSTIFIPPCQPPFVPIGTPPRQHKFVKSSSIARLFGNTYNAKKFEKDEQKRLANGLSSNGGKFNTYGGRRRATGPYLERFKRYSKEDGDIASDAMVEEKAAAVGGVTLTTDSRDLYGGSRNELVGLEHHYHEAERQEDLSSKALRTISRGLGKLWFKRTHSVEISAPDPEFKVSYLGNVLTGWAKGEGCVEKQLNTLWRNYTQNNKPDVIMRIKVCASGLKATTRQHGLTEYWANRITHCCAPKNYPRVFCWIYRHEGRKLKHELRCHAVLCSKEKIVHDICNTLKENLERALRDFKREKILKQNARLSLANAAYDNPSLPRRKILLSVGGNNYRPPLERSKSAPKLMAIEEAIGEEEGEEAEDTNEPEMKACCQKDSLYPAMTLGRRRCRRGHSIRRTGKTRPNFGECMQMEVSCCSDSKCKETKDNKVVTTAATHATTADNTVTGSEAETELRNSYGSDDSDDFEKLLKYNNYDANASLSNELLPYFDMQLHKNTSSSLGSLTELKDYEEPLSLLPTINSDPSADPEADYSPHMETNEMDDTVMMVGLRRNGVCSDGEEDYLEADDMYFRQASILNMLHRNSMRKMANICLSSDENSSIETNASTSLNYRHQVQSSISSNASSTATSVSATTMDNSVAAGLTAAGETNGTQRKQQLNTADSDEGSISSGCETASTVTANQDDLSLKYRQSKQIHGAELMQLPLVALDTVQNQNNTLTDESVEPIITADEIYQRLETRLQKRHNSDATTFSSSSSITLKLSSSPTASINDLDIGSANTDTTNGANAVTIRNRRTRRQAAQREQQQNAADDTDSECSDESGYVEYQEKERKSVKDTIALFSAAAQTKPQPPPKPMPRRSLQQNTNATKSTSTAV